MHHHGRGGSYAKGTGRRRSRTVHVRLTLRLAALSPEQVTAREFAGDPIDAKLSRAPSNGALLGGLKVVTRRGWFAARPSGTEDVYKIYAESFAGEAHLRQIQTAAQELVEQTVGS